MKRALAFAVVALFIGLAGLAQVSGTWKGKIQILPSTNLGLVYTSLELKYTIAGFELTSYSKFTSAGFTFQKFGISGTVGPADISGEMGFDPTGPVYSYAWLSSSLSFGGVDINSEVFHGVYPYASDTFSDKYDKGDRHIHLPPYYYTFEGVYSDACQTPQTGSILLFYTLGISADPLSVTAHFVDCCTGTEFYDLDISLSDLSLCCGITYDLEVYFTKEGFQWADFYISPLFELCCGISIAVDVTFGIDKKELTIIPKWAGVKNCITVWGEPYWDSHYNSISALDIWGWKIYCEFAECNKLEIVTALDKSKFWDVGGKLVISKSQPAYASPYFQGDEAEYIKIETCGAGCCGGNWSLSAQTFFAVNTSGGLFGITRTKVSATVPVMSNLSLSISMELPYSGSASLYLGWSFSF